MLLDEGGFIRVLSGGGSDILEAAGKPAFTGTHVDRRVEGHGSNDGVNDVGRIALGADDFVPHLAGKPLRALRTAIHLPVPGPKPIGRRHLPDAERLERLDIGHP